MLVLVGCGRIAFEPLGSSADARGDGANAPGDGATAPFDTSGSIAGDTCATARPIAIGQTLASESIAGAADDLGNACGNGPELVYAFTQPAMMSRTVSITATFSGAVRQSDVCPPVSTNCQSFAASSPKDAQMTHPAGTIYVMIDKTTGAGTTFTISLQ